MFFLYNSLLLAAAFLVLPYYLFKALFTGKYRQSLGSKLGLFIPETIRHLSGTPRIWVHAVSVGEVTAAQPVVAALRSQFPKAALIVSTSTETGQKMARNFMPDNTSYIYYPLDIPWVINKVLNIIEPDIFVTTETELWPNFLRICARRKIKMVMINGRLSPKSFILYELTSFFWKNIVNNFDAVGVISAEHGRRFAALGLKPEKIFLLGNAKYDGLAAQASSARDAEWAAKLKLWPEDLILVAGSTHEGEEKVILAVFKKLKEAYPAFKVIIAPRHVERADRVLMLAKAAGFPDTLTISQIEEGRDGCPQVVVVDGIGLLFKIYSLATVVFCGGSLVPKGGQNILEAAAWGRFVFYGPYMDDFADEAAGLERVGAGRRIRSGEDLLNGILEVMAEPDLLREKGRLARSMVQANMGVALKYAEMVRKVLGIT